MICYHDIIDTIHLYGAIMISFLMVQVDNLPNQRNFVSARQNMRRRILVILDDKLEYDRMKDLSDFVRYHGKLMSYYGFDTGNGKWNTKAFPVTQTDGQLEGINSDIERYNKAVRDYNKYAEYLANKYSTDISQELKKGCTISFLPPTSLNE